MNYAINYKNQVIRFYGYTRKSKSYYAMVNYSLITAPTLQELCNKIGISRTALRHDVPRNDIK